MTIDALMNLPWSWVGPREVSEDGQKYWMVEIRELPGFLVAAESRQTVLAEVRAALRAFLESYLEHGEEPPRPAFDPGIEVWQYMLGRRPEQPVARMQPEGSKPSSASSAIEPERFQLA